MSPPRRSNEWLDDCIRWCEAVINVLTKQAAVDPDQQAQDAKDLVSTRKWLAELRAERAQQ